METDAGRPRADDFSLEPLAIIDPIRLEGVPVPGRRWLWDGWIPLGHVTALYGDGGTGKSLLAQQLMTCCAARRAFLGSPVLPCRALGVFCEDDGDELHRRQAQINAQHAISFGDLEDMRWISRVGGDNLLMTFAADGHGRPTPFFFQLLTEAQASGVRLVVIDTAADTFGGNENIRPQVRQFIGLLTRLAQAIDGAVVLLAHPSQTGRTTGSGDGGSTAWSNSVRARLYLRRPEPVGGDVLDADLRILSRVKANYAQAGEELGLRYHAGAFTGDGAAAPGAAEQTPDRQRAAEEAFLAGLAELAAKNLRCNVHKGQANHAPKVIREKTGLGAAFSEDELEAAMNRLIRADRIASVEEGPPSRRRSYLVITAPALPGV